MVEELSKKLQTGYDKLKQVQKDLHKALNKKRQLDAQLNENTAVKEELELLKSGNEVFKLIGPVLIKQDQEEAKQNVKKRIEYISSEIKRTDDVISTLEREQETQHESLSKLQDAHSKLMAKQPPS